MDDFFYEKSQLFKKVTDTTTRLNWPALIIESALLGEEFQELTISTLISYYETICHEKALDQTIYCGNEEKWYKDINKLAIKIMNGKVVYVSERVDIKDDFSGNIIINDSIITDQSVIRALQMLEQSKIPGVTAFGQPTTFTKEEIVRRRNEIYSR